MLTMAIPRAALALILIIAGIASAQDAPTPTLADRLEPLIAAHKGRVAVAVHPLDGREGYRHNDETPMPTASLIKFPIMIEAYRQAEAKQTDLAAPVELREEDKVPGSGILTPHFSAGARFSLRDAIRLMIAYSDNTSTNLVLDRIGLGATAATMEAMGFPDTKVHSKVYRRDTSLFPERSRQFGLGSTKAADMVELLARLHRRELVSPEASEAMLDHLLACQDRSMLRRHLPDGTKVYHKTGAVSDTRTSAGIIETPSGPVAVCVLTTENEDQRWSDDNAAERLIAAIGRAVHDHYDSGPPANGQEPAATTLRLGDDGPRVVELQRRLNARLDPSPMLRLDGAFGPLTEAAVIRFQRGLQREPTGVVDPDTWEALDAPAEPARAP